MCGWPLLLLPHLDPGNSVIDEVLAVGDADFSKNAWQKLNPFHRKGKNDFFCKS